MVDLLKYAIEREISKDKRHKKVILDVIRIGVYTRVSTQEQAQEGQSLDAQRTKIDSYITLQSIFENKKLEISYFSDEGRSAKDLNRLELQKLLNAIKHDHIDYVIVTKLDRLTRRVRDIYELIQLFESHDTTLLSINESLDTKSAGGRAIIGMFGIMAQMEREQVSERVHDVFEQIVKNQPVGGPTPFGYLYIPQQPIGIYIPYTQEYCVQYGIPPLKVGANKKVMYPGDYVKLIFMWYPYIQNFARIGRRLTEHCVPTPYQVQQALHVYFEEYYATGTSVDGIYIANPKPWNGKSLAISDILSNYFYTGARFWNRWNKNAKKRRSPKHWIAIENAHPALVNEHIFLFINHLIDQKRKHDINITGLDGHVAGSFTQTNSV